jgi:hypothetical protein
LDIICTSDVEGIAYPRHNVGFAKFRNQTKFIISEIWGPGRIRGTYLELAIQLELQTCMRYGSCELYIDSENTIYQKV